MNDLSRSETRELAECEAVIERGLRTFIEVGSALLKIRDARLYRATYGTFENYCQERWQMSRPAAYRMIEAAQVCENVSPIGDIPKTESVTRPLAPLPPDQQREAWSRATEEYGQPTAAQVRATVDEMFPRHEPLNGQGKMFDDEPSDPREQHAEAWIKIVNDMCIAFTSFDRRGGGCVLTRDWPQDRKEGFIGTLEHFIERAKSLINQVKEKP